MLPVLGDCFGCFLFSIKDFLKLQIFQKATKDQQYKLLRLTLCLTFGVVVLGIVAYVIDHYYESEKGKRSHQNHLLESAIVESPSIVGNKNNITINKIESPNLVIN